MLKRDSDQKESHTMKEAGSSKDSFWWEKVWKLKVPPKIRVFWWRAVQEFLPAKAELRRRHVVQEDHCEACGEPRESLFHVAFRCTYAVRFWQAVLEVTGCKIPNLHPASWTKHLLLGSICSLKDVALFICGVWALWTGRNARRHGRKLWSPLATVKHVAAMLEDLLCQDAKKEEPRQVRKAKWEKPDLGWYKVNTDASFVAASGWCSGGAVIRNADGKIVRVAANVFSACS